MEYKEQLEEIVQNFDFELVQKTMRLLDWKWAGKKETHIPNISELVHYVMTTCDRCHEQWILTKKGYYVHSGGFLIGVNEFGLLDVKFVLTEWVCENY